MTARGLMAAAAALALALPSGAASAVPPPRLLTPFIWRIEAPESPPGEGDHLIGTIHVGLSDTDRLAPEALRLVRQAQRLVVEVDLAAVTAETVGHYTRLPDPDGLRKLLPAPTWEALQRACDAQGLALGTLRGIKPWYVTLMVVPVQAPAETLMDSRLVAEARAAGVTTAFLETAEDQLRALDAVSDEEDVRQLQEVVADPSRAAAELAGLEQAYRASDLPALERYLFAPDRLAAYPDFYDRVFFERNRRWLPAIERIARRERACVAVGLGHLIGERGVLATLAARGWRIRRGV